MLLGSRAGPERQRESQSRRKLQTLKSLDCSSLFLPNLDNSNLKSSNLNLSFSVTRHGERWDEVLLGHHLCRDGEEKPQKQAEHSPAANVSQKDSP